MTEPKLTEIDWQDSNKIFAYGVGTVAVAQDYQTARKTFANSIKRLKIGLATAYKTKSIERKITEAKAYLLLADKSEPMKQALLDMIESEHEYKGLEKVLETRQAVVSLAQSLIKNKPRE